MALVIIPTDGVLSMLVIIPSVGGGNDTAAIAVIG